MRTSVGCPRAPFSVGSKVMQASGAEAAWARGCLLNIAARSATTISGTRTHVDLELAYLLNNEK